MNDFLGCFNGKPRKKGNISSSADEGSSDTGRLSTRLDRCPVQQESSYQDGWSRNQSHGACLKTDALKDIFKEILKQMAFLKLFGLQGPWVFFERFLEQKQFHSRAPVRTNERPSAFNPRNGSFTCEGVSCSEAVV